MEDMKQHKDNLRKIANWLIGVNVPLLVLYYIVFKFIDHSPEYFLSDLARISAMSLIVGIYLKGSYCWMIMRLNLSWQPTLEVWGSPRTLSSMTERCNPYSEVTHFNTGHYVNSKAESASSSRMLPCHTEIMLIC